VQGLQEGDRNTKFFHRSIIQRRQHNHITTIKPTQGNLVTKHEEIEQELVSYFSNLLTKTQHDFGKAISKITHHTPKLVSLEQNKTLLRPITLTELEQAIMEMPKGKSQDQMTLQRTSFMFVGLS
jgi:hypothetical protein